MNDVAVQLPLYGCLTGIELPLDRLEVLPGIVLRRVYVDMLSASMLAFVPPHCGCIFEPGAAAGATGGFRGRQATGIDVRDHRIFEPHRGIAAEACRFALRCRVAEPENEVR